MTRTLNKHQQAAFVDLIMSAVDVFDGWPIYDDILRSVLKHRERKGRWHITPAQVRHNLGWCLDKLVSGGRLGVLYYNREAMEELSR